MIDKFVLKCKTGFDDNLFYSNKGVLDIKSNYEDLGLAPVEIQLWVPADDDSEKERELILTISGYYFDIAYAYDANVSIFDIFDSYSQETYELYEALFLNEEYKEEFEVINLNLFYLNDIKIEDKFRKDDYFDMILNKLEEIVLYVAKLNVGVIAVLSSAGDDMDISEEEKTEFKEKMRDILQDNEYKYVSEYNDDYLVKVLY